MQTPSIVIPSRNNMFIVLELFSELNVMSERKRYIGN
jgi:hypothetical protein